MPMPPKQKRFNRDVLIAWLDSNGYPERPAAPAAAEPAAPAPPPALIEETEPELSSDQASEAERAQQPKRRRKPKVDPLVKALVELYPPHGDVPDMPPKSDVQILGQIERRHPELKETFSEDSVNRARKLTREAALTASEK
jgi:hypothetical protein